MGRYLVGAWAQTRFAEARLPIGTLLVNLAGCLIIGFLSGMAEKRGWLGGDARLLLVTGFLGGFTTFSAFGLETLNLLRRSQGTTALLYVGVSVAGGLLAAALGFKASDWLPSRVPPAHSADTHPTP